MSRLPAVSNGSQLNFKSLKRNQSGKKSVRSQIVTGIVFVAIITISVTAPRTARAGSRKIFLETIGISTAMGTVLGASTLPFYDQPGTHLINLVYGASIGAVAGVGLGLYQWLAGKSERDQEIFGERSFNPLTLERSRERSTYASNSQFTSNARLASEQKVTGLNPRPVLLWAPLVSLTW